MRIVTCAILSFSLAALSPAAEPYRAAEADWGKIVDGVTLKKGILGFGSLRLGMTRGEAEKAIGASLPVHKEEVPACGEWTTAMFEHAGAMVSLQFSTSVADAKIQSIGIDIPRGNNLTDRAAVQNRLKKHAASLFFVPAMHEPMLPETEVWAPVYSPSDNPKQAVILIFPSGRMVVSLAECLE